METNIEQLKDFIESKYANTLLIDGEWGIGKTHFLRKDESFLDLCKKNNRKHIYLNSKEISTKDLKTAIYMNDSDSELIKKAKSTKIPFLNPLMGLTEIGLQIYANNMNLGDKLIIIDEMERKADNIDLKDLFCKIFESKESNKNVKIILAINSKKLNEKDLLIFNSWKDKIVDMEANFTINEAHSFYVEEINELLKNEFNEIDFIPFSNEDIKDLNLTPRMLKKIIISLEKTIKLTKLDLKKIKNKEDYTINKEYFLNFIYSLSCKYLNTHEDSNVYFPFFSTYDYFKNYFPERQYKNIPNEENCVTRFLNMRFDNEHKNNKNISLEFLINKDLKNKNIKTLQELLNYKKEYPEEQKYLKYSGVNEYNVDSLFQDLKSATSKCVDDLIVEGLFKNKIIVKKTEIKGSVELKKIMSNYIGSKKPVGKEKEKIIKEYKKVITENPHFISYNGFEDFFKVFENKEDFIKYDCVNLLHLKLNNIEGSIKEQNSLFIKDKIKLHQELRIIKNLGTERSKMVEYTAKSDIFGECFADSLKQRADSLFILLSDSFEKENSEYFSIVELMNDSNPYTKGIRYQVHGIFENNEKYIESSAKELFYYKEDIENLVSKKEKIETFILFYDLGEKVNQNYPNKSKTLFYKKMEKYFSSFK